MTPGIQGTIAYLAPEQLRCEAADGRADLFSLGVVLYELSSGCRPFTAPNIAALYELFRDDKFLKSLKGKQRYERLLAKLKREDEGYRREFASTS